MCIKRLRPRIEPLGLAIRTVRQRGYFLELNPRPTVAAARHAPEAVTALGVEEPTS